MNAEYTARCQVRLEALRSHPEARSIFLNTLGFCKLPGSALVQTDLAKTLRALAKGVPYRKVVGEPLVAYLKDNGGVITERDFDGAVLRERAPVEGTFHGKHLVSMPPPSSGGAIVIALLRIYEQARALHPEANRHHLWTQASRAVFFDRARYFGDPDFVSVPIEKLVSPDYAKSLAERLKPNEELPLPKEVPPKSESQHTTHFSIVDKNGMAVAMTLTINVPFGTGMVVPGTGVLLNNQMDDFFVSHANSFGLVGNENNAPEPGKIPLSSMAPTMLLEGDELLAVLGSPGGSSIPSAVASVIRNLYEDGLDGEAAVRRGRIHHQWSPTELQVERYFDETELSAVSGQKRGEPKFPVGRVQLVVRDKSGFYGVSDCRDQGAPFHAKL